VRPPGETRKLIESNPFFKLETANSDIVKADSERPRLEKILAIK